MSEVNRIRTPWSLSKEQILLQYKKGKNEKGKKDQICTTFFSLLLQDIAI